MKLDEPNNTNKPKVLINKKKETHNDINQLLSDANLSLADLLSPLKSISINTSFDAFYNFKEFEQIKKEFEKVIQSQTNIIFYVLHNNFMCDEAHREFFKNMVGRFYDLPERLWKYYRGVFYSSYRGSDEILTGLVLLENVHIFRRVENNDFSFYKTTFFAENERETSKYYFNQVAMVHLSGLTNYDYTLTKEFVLANSKDLRTPSFRYNNSNIYILGRFDTQSSVHYVPKGENYYWYIPKKNDLSDYNRPGYRFSKGRYPYVATFYTEKFKDYIDQFKHNQEKIVIENLEFNLEEFQIIHSISQTFPWTKEYIFENEEYLNLDVLGLNMTVPWDIELVKFFIERGYGGRLSENKAIFDKVFEPILSDEILDLLFKSSYEKYEVK